MYLELVKRPTKKEIKASVDSLKAPAPKSTPAQIEGQLSEKKTSQRIRKQGSY